MKGINGGQNSSDELTSEDLCWSNKEQNEVEM
jgi:hypothetical protein